MSSRHLLIPLLLLLLVTGIQGLFNHEQPEEKTPPPREVEEVIPAEESSAIPADEEDLAANGRPAVIDAAPASRAILAKPQSDERGK